ncbi:MAG: hypothetical protein IIC90_00750 [Chloroflexi bacterium]|nr:hypothetical protein [Chloroflexota bacterium]
MRALIAALIFMLAVAVTASIFAMWPVVGDAPWEDDVPIVQDGTNELRLLLRVCHLTIANVVLLRCLRTLKNARVLHSDHRSRRRL